MRTHVLAGMAVLALTGLAAGAAQAQGCGGGYGASGYGPSWGSPYGYAPSYLYGYSYVPAPSYGYGYPPSYSYGYGYAPAPVYVVPSHHYRPQSSFSFSFGHWR